jgi:lysozyme
MNREAIYRHLKIDEGVVYEIYNDHLGYATFGVGHLVLDTDPEFGQDVGTPVSEERVRECFEKDLDTAISECKVLYEESWEGFPSEVQEVLVNMLFNLGRPRLSKFKNFNTKLIEGDYAGAAPEGLDSLWARQVGARANRLMERLENVS